MEIVGKTVSIDEAADLLAQGSVTKKLEAGDLSAQWVTDSQGVKSVLVQGLGDQLIQLHAV